jgi:hypothetical protein
MSVLMGVIAISLNLRLEAWEFRHPPRHDDALSTQGFMGRGSAPQMPLQG